MLIWVCVAATIVLTVAGQLLQKQLAMQTPQAPSAALLGYYARQPLFWAAIVALGLAMLSWLVVLDNMPVSKAYPLLGGNYFIMLLVARLAFGEQVPIRRWLGAAVVVAGITLVSVS